MISNKWLAVTIERRNGPPKRMIEGMQIAADSNPCASEMSASQFQVIVGSGQGPVKSGSTSFRWRCTFDAAFLL